MEYNPRTTDDWALAATKEKRARRERARRREIRRRKRRIRRIKAYSILLVIIICFVLFLTMIVKAICSFWGTEEAIDDENSIHEEVGELQEIAPLIDTLDIDVQLLPINEYSRPGIAVDLVDKVVIHYVGNPGTTGQQNHDYYESLIETKQAKISSNYVVGLEGEMIECVPPGEIAYASNHMNRFSVSIEVCHYDKSGEFTDESYNATILLAAALCQKYGLGVDDVIRHYDVTGKECPIYYVEHEDKWEQLKQDIEKILLENDQLI